MAGNHFPVGMRVLAVDGDQIGLKVLENLLRKCQYHVTTTTQAIEALEMLRKNKNEFELVISDVNMADMDGFKFLEQVVIEMDLPIIMLSGYSDKQSVMKSITCGACYCLIKPVRVEVLGNIWQHVVRKRIDGKNRDMTANKEKIYNMAGKDVQSIITSYNNPDHNKLVGKKRKKQVEQKEPYNKENGEKNGEASTRKKSRLVWTAELHRKFVYAVNQLGLDKAYPRRLLELMNIKGLTKEHVASHLQKYRLSLKKPIQHSWINENGDFGTLFESRSILENKLSSFGSYGTCKLNSPSPHGMNLSTSNSFISSQNILTSTKTQNSAVFHSPVEASSVHVESLDTDICADLLEHWPNEAWSGNQTQLSTFSVHSSPSSEVFNSDPHTHNYLNFSPTFPSEKSAVDFSPQSDVADFLEDVRVQIENQENLLENTFHQQWCWSSFGGC